MSTDGFHPVSEKTVNRLFYTLLFLHLVPLFFGKYFLTQDGPSHLYNAFVLKDMVFNHHSFYTAWFDINKVPNPNWLVTIFYALSMTVLPAFLAEKIFLVLYVVLLPLSFRFLIKQINLKSSFIALLIFPLVYNITLYLGFFNFCFSIIFYFYAVGYWLKYQGVFSLKKQIAFLLLVTLTYFSHPVSFVVLVMTIGIFILSMLYQEIKSKNKPVKHLLRMVYGLFISLLPSLIFFLMFFGESGSEISFTTRNVKTYIIDQLQNYGLNYSGKADLRICTAYSAILAFFFIYNLIIRIKTKRFYRPDILYLFFILFSIMTFFSPEEIAGGSVILIRLILYSNIIAILCISAYSYPARLKKISACLFFGFALFWLVFKSYHFEKIQERFETFRSIENQIPEGKTVLPFVIHQSNPDGSPLDTIKDIDIIVFLHTANYLSIEKKLLCLSDYEASQSYFPLKWKPNKDPSTFFPEYGEMLSDSEFSAYGAKSGTWPDYVLVWDESGRFEERKLLIGEIGKNYLPGVRGAKAWLWKRKF